MADSGAGVLSTTVDLPGMTQAYSAFTHAVSQCKSSESNMESQITALGSHWEGEAATTFGSAMRTWIQNFQTVCNELQKMTNVLESNTASYRQTHNTTIENAGQVQGLMARTLPHF